MPAKIHIVVSAILAVLLGWIFQSFWLGLLGWLAGWAFDADHLLDYFIYLKKTKTRFKWSEFFSGSYLKAANRIYVFCHAWEYLLVWLVVGGLMLPWSFIVSFGLPYFLHLVLDQLQNQTKPLAYFLVYRVKIGFKLATLCRG